MVNMTNSSPLGKRGTSTPEAKSSEVLPVTPENKPAVPTFPCLNTPINPPPLRSALTSLPRPLFKEEPETFSTKKDRKRSYGQFKPPPRPPAKSCPPKSRIFQDNDLYKAQSVTFLDSPDGKTVTGTPFQSKVYDRKKKESYFHQAFTIQSEIGAGCFGTVYRVVSKEDGKQYAVKIARERYKGYIDRDRKLEEVRKHQFLPPHSNLVKFYTSWEEQGRLYQQFELCNGNLQEYAENHNNIPEKLIWGYLVDLLQAVQHLHDHDLVHMDIKPDNIFFGYDGICKLGDFGLIVDLTNLSHGGAREGDSKYLAPEILKGIVTKACDVFSLGISILELACDLDLPSKGELWTDLRSRGPDPTLTLGLSPELRRVVQLMMTHDPERRPSVKQILELPSVSKAMRRREREMFWSQVCAGLKWLLLPFLLLYNLLAHVCLVKQLPRFWLWHRNRETAELTPPPDPVTGAWASDCFSDDENDCTVSSEGSELAAPLQESTSSETNTAGPTTTTTSPTPRQMSARKPSFLPFERDNDDMSPVKRDDEYRPDMSPVRRPKFGGATGSLLRSRVRFSARTPGHGTSSPQKRLLFLPETLENSGSSPLTKLETSRLDRAGSSRLDRAGSCQPAQADKEGEEELQISFHPQSLAATFDCFSDDE